MRDISRNHSEFNLDMRDLYVLLGSWNRRSCRRAHAYSQNMLRTMYNNHRHVMRLYTAHCVLHVVLPSSSTHSFCFLYNRLIFIALFLFCSEFRFLFLSCFFSSSLLYLLSFISIPSPPLSPPTPPAPAATLSSFLPLICISPTITFARRFHWRSWCGYDFATTSATHSPPVPWTSEKGAGSTRCCFRE